MIHQWYKDSRREKLHTKDEQLQRKWAKRERYRKEMKKFNNSVPATQDYYRNAHMRRAKKLYEADYKAFKDKSQRDK